MKELENLPPGIEIYTNIISSAEAEYLIDNVENAVNNNFYDQQLIAGTKGGNSITVNGNTLTKTEDMRICNTQWGIPNLHSPDATCLRRNNGINLSEHGFLNTQCICGIKEIDGLIGKLMLKCLEKYINKYQIGFTQDEGLLIIKQGENHTNEYSYDDNPFINRILSMHMPLNINNGEEYMKFKYFDFSVVLSKPSIILFPSSFIYSYSKNKIDGLYEIQNYFNNNPNQEYLEQLFGNNN